MSSCLLLVFVQLILSNPTCGTYDQHRQLMTRGKLSLSWRTDQEMVHFKLEGLSSSYVGLAFSYNNLPVDSFVAGIDDTGDIFAEDLHLDYAGIASVYCRVDHQIFV